MSKKNHETQEQGYIEAMIDFGKRVLSFSSEAIGKTVPFNFRGISYEIIFPNFEPLTRPSNDVRTPAKYQVSFKQSALLMQWDQPKTMHEGKYGSAYGYDKAGLVSKFSLSCVAIRSTHCISRNRAEQVEQNLTVWRDCLITWLEVTGFMDFENKSAYVEQKEPLTVFFMSSNIHRKPYIIEGAMTNRTITIHVNQPRIITLKLLLKSIDATSDSVRQPPTYYATLITAIKYHNKQDYRNSLFNTSTAIEIALSELLNRRLSTLNSQQKTTIMNQTKQIANLVRAVRTTGLVISGDIQLKIANPRNNAIHRGVHIEESQSLEAIEVAKHFMLTHLPIVHLAE